ncbi:glycosyltransferase family 4 protein [Qipengyuania sp. CAU 1752]
MFLTRYPVEGASSRYRVHQYIPHLKELGFDCTVQSFMDSEMYHLSLSSGATGRKIWLTAKACLRRLRVLAQFREFQVVYMQRELFPFGPPVVERALARLGVPLAFDYDDALFIKKPSRYNPIATFFRSPDKTRKILRLVDCTVAGNNWLRDIAIAEKGHAVTVEVAEDVSRFATLDEKLAQNRPLTIGWLGSPSTAKYMAEIEGVLRQVAKANPHVRWEIMGGGEFSQDGIDWETHDWSIEKERAALARYDIGLMPLPKQQWSRGKSGGKARTYMAAGVVPVVQAIGYNLELIRHGETGFLCDEDADWSSNLQKLIDDRDLRVKMASAAREDIEKRFSVRKKAAEIAAVLHDLAKGRKPA